MKIRRFEETDRVPIARLNERLRASGVKDCVYPEGSEQHSIGTVRQRLFVAADNGDIRGGVWLKEQTFRVRGEDIVCGWLKYPVAESLIDTRFSGVPGSLIVHCLREQPRLLALGLGGHGTPLARMLAGLRWIGMTVPMLVRVVRPARSLRQLAPLRSRPLRRMMADAAAMTGFAWLAQRLIDLGTIARGGRTPRGYAGEPQRALGLWADDVWQRTRDAYGFIASRDPSTVDSMLPQSPDVYRLRVRCYGSDVGWANVIRHDFSVGAPDPRFGQLTVGLIADCLAMPAHARGVMGTALDFLLSSGVDLVFSNQLHTTWANALRRAGFFETRSNFALYCSPATARLGVDWARECHMNRGDCDGPIWYRQPAS